MVTTAPTSWTSHSTGTTRSLRDNFDEADVEFTLDWISMNRKYSHIDDVRKLLVLVEADKPADFDEPIEAAFRVTESLKPSLRLNGAFSWVKIVSIFLLVGLFSALLMLGLSDGWALTMSCSIVVVSIFGSEFALSRARRAGVVAVTPTRYVLLSIEADGRLKVVSELPRSYRMQTGFRRVAAAPIHRLGTNGPPIDFPDSGPWRFDWHAVLFASDDSYSTADLFDDLDRD